MNIVSGKYHDGKIILDAPVDWAEGVPVQVSPTVQKIGITEAEWPITHEGIEEKDQAARCARPGRANTRRGGRMGCCEGGGQRLHNQKDERAKGSV